MIHTSTAICIAFVAMGSSLIAFSQWRSSSTHPIASVSVYGALASVPAQDADESSKFAVGRATLKRRETLLANTIRCLSQLASDADNIATDAQPAMIQEKLKARTKELSTISAEWRSLPAPVDPEWSVLMLLHGDGVLMVATRLSKHHARFRTAIPDSGNAFLQSSSAWLLEIDNIKRCARPLFTREVTSAEVAAVIRDDMARWVGKEGNRHIRFLQADLHFEFKGRYPKPEYVKSINGAPAWPTRRVQVEGLLAAGKALPLEATTDNVFAVLRDAVKKYIQQSAVASRPDLIPNSPRSDTSFPLLPGKGLISKGRNAKGFEEYALSKDPTVVLIKIPGGTFQMGSDAGNSHEKPAHEVKLSPYYISKYEITNAQFARFCQETSRGLPKAPPWGQGADLPVVNVSWTDANAYCTWAGLHLPTEAEWEYAARGPKAFKFPWGEGSPTDRLARFGQDGKAGPVKVGSYPEGTGPFGALDQAGNVDEWCWDRFASNYSPGSQTDPMGPMSGSFHVCRGGNYFYDAEFACSTRRHGNEVGDRWRYLGFRPALRPSLTASEVGSKEEGSAPSTSPTRGSRRGD